jgi:hypothetical protein
MDPLLTYVLIMIAIGLVWGLALRLAGSQKERPKDAALIFFPTALAIDRIAHLLPARRKKTTKTTAGAKRGRTGRPKPKRRPRPKTSA